MADTRPSFQFYPRDYLTSVKVLAMSYEARGLYVHLLCLCWLEGSLPADPAMLARLCHLTPKAFAPLWRQVSPCFTSTDDRLRNARLDREREKQDTYRDAKSRAGKLGNQKRWRATPEPSHSDASATRKPVAEHRSSSSSASSVQPSVVEDPEKGAVGVPAAAAPPQHTSLRLHGKRNLDLMTYGPVKLWASQYRDEILPLVATHHGGDRDAADGPARAWVGEVDERNRTTTPGREAVAKPVEWWREQAAARWAESEDAVFMRETLKLMEQRDARK
jgi:uncharacterized protein YdaU (DUF1376 family)